MKSPNRLERFEGGVRFTKPKLRDAIAYPKDRQSWFWLPSRYPNNGWSGPNSNSRLSSRSSSSRSLPTWTSLDLPGKPTCPKVHVPPVSRATARLGESGGAHFMSRALVAKNCPASRSARSPTTRRRSRYPPRGRVSSTGPTSTSCVYIIPFPPNHAIGAILVRPGRERKSTKDAMIRARTSRGSIRFSAPPPTRMSPVLMERSVRTDSAPSSSTELLSVLSSPALAHPAANRSNRIRANAEPLW